ncbi:3-oxoacyl-ACP reductase FabG [Acidipropionibacterium thoenii]|uniref:3-oxoacyl-ACP reductase FabG n=1 Tax=Acidipropionibacterium thoenii TaxID=1751 RepID=UPI0004823DD7|nr:3-oxoacyl-ACP reductase FabG [Acidipropionibacterium thoenii]
MTVEDPGQGRVALVTGGSRGIGAAIARALAADGYRVAATSRSGTAPEGVLPVVCDVTDAASVDAAFATVEAELGPVEVLIANAGITKDTLLARMSEEDFTSVLDTNLTGAYRVIRRAARAMTRARFGRIVVMSSVVGLLGSPGQVNYAASKAGLIGIARSVSRELGARGITCNVVAPGFIATDMTASLPDKTVEDYTMRIPARRLGEVDDVVNAVRFLASDATSYITGAVIPVDGGLGMGH